MNISILTENHPAGNGFAAEHGLSVFIETPRHKILLDSGQTGLFAYHAAKLGIDLAETDTVILSHGHHDHAGGLLTFAAINPHAPIYMQRSASGSFYHGGHFIGMDERILSLPQVVLLDGDHRIDEELSLFTRITGRRFWPQANLELMRLADGISVQDDFIHEQCLVVESGNKKVLLSGCAHNGILNILDRFRSIYGTDPVAVISGFHMMKKTEYTAAERQVITDTARELAGTSAVFYTGHCTGRPAFEQMKPILGDQLVEIGAGMQFTL